MGITRRQFLKWSGASTLGAVIFNGCRIPDEELQIESPVNMPEDLVTGVDNWYATICGQDHESCGVIVRVVEGRAKKIEGNPDYPVNQGKHGVRSEAGLQALYHPDRIAKPLSREGRSGEFAEISWDEARRKLVDKMNGSDSNRFVMITDPLRGHLALVANEFVKANGGKHMTFEPIAEKNLHEAIKSVFGQQRLPDFDIENTNYLLSFGADFLSTWLSPVRYSRAYGEFRQGGHKRGTHVQVDSRFSMTTANADDWVPVKPGGEGVLAMSMIYVILKEGLGSSSAADILTDGGGYEALNAFDPNSSRVKEATGIDPHRIEGMALAFANPSNQPSLAIGGGSAGAHSSGLFNLIAIYSLNLLVGNVNKAGGVYIVPDSPLEELNQEAVLNMGTGASLEDWQGLSNGVDLLMIRGANPVHGLPDESNFGAVINSASFVVTYASFMDETAAMSDLVLPENTYLEEWGDDVPSPGPRYQVVGIQQPVVRPFHAEARSFGDDLLALGDDLGLSLGAKLGLAGNDNPTLLDLIRKGAEKLFAEGRGSVRAATFDGFWNGVLQRGGWWDMDSTGEASVIDVKALPLGKGFPEITSVGPEGQDTYNLVPFLSNSMMDGKLANLPWLQATPDPITSVVWDSWVEINLSTAEAKGIREGDILEVKSSNGTIEAPAYPHPGVPPWSVNMPIGQGHTSLGRYAEGVGSSTISILAPVMDTDTRSLAWAATRVSITNTGRNVDLPKYEGAVLAVQTDPEVIKITGLDSHAH